MMQIDWNKKEPLMSRSDGSEGDMEYKDCKSIGKESQDGSIESDVGAELEKILQRQGSAEGCKRDFRHIRHTHIR